MCRFAAGAQHSGEQSGAGIERGGEFDEFVQPAAWAAARLAAAARSVAATRRTLPLARPARRRPAVHTGGHTDLPSQPSHHAHGNDNHTPP